MQRDEAAKRAETGKEWQPRYFRAVQGGPGGPEEGEEDLDWILNANMWVLLATPSIPPAADVISDGPSSEAITKQILAIAPIVKGQRASQQSQQPQQPQQFQQTPSPAQNAQQPVGGHGDLIDFGQEAPQAQHVLPQRSAQQQPIQDTYTSGPGLQAPLQPEIGEPIVRRDTNTGAVDEFVDAEEP